MTRASRCFEAVSGLAALASVLSLVALAAAPAHGQGGDNSRPRFGARLHGYEEVPAVFTPARGSFEARLASNGESFTYRLSYSGLATPVRMAHIHFGQRGVNGNVVVFLCDTAGFPDPTGLAPECPASPGGEVTGTIDADNVTALAAAQGIGAGQLGKLLRAMRDGMTYANVHTDAFPGGEIRGQIGRGGGRGGDQASGD